MAVVRTELVPLAPAPGFHGRRGLSWGIGSRAAARRTPAVTTGATARGRLDALLDRYEAPLYDYVARLTGDVGVAARVTGDLLAAAALAPPSLGAPGSPAGERRTAVWLFARATARCTARPRWGASWPGPLAALGRAAARAARLPAHSGGSRPAPGAPRPARPARVRDARFVLESLPPAQRACVLLREHHGFAYDEIAEVLRTSRPAVAALLAGAREEICR
jgi:DNA-directed RNA polymerase specialized sigma24 family protein